MQKKLYDSVAGQLFHVLHHCFEGFMCRNEINAKNVFCHVKCFEKNENIWKVTRVTVFCQEYFWTTYKTTLENSNKYPIFGGF